MDPHARAQLAEVLERTPDDDEPTDTLIVEAIHNLWHGAARRGFGRPCTVRDA